MLFCAILVAFLLYPAWVPDSAAQMNLRGTSTAGRRLFHSPSISTNGLSCAYCHADFDERTQSDGLIRAGHSMYNVAGRGTWWGKDPAANDAYQNAATAAVVCVEHYMRNPKRLDAQQMLDLQAYLTALTPNPNAGPLALAPAADKTGRYDGFDDGNRFSGRSLFYATCHSCHPNGGPGIGPAIPRKRAPGFYARKVREGDGLGAVLSGVDPNAYDPRSGKFMPFFGADRLTDQQIRDIIAFLLAPEGSRQGP